jgi:hypothetical protein
VHAEGDGAAQAFAAAAAHAFAAGGAEGVAIARAFAVAIGIYSCPGVKPVLTRELTLVLADINHSRCPLLTAPPLTSTRIQCSEPIEKHSGSQCVIENPGRPL